MPPAPVDMAALTAGKKIVIFGLPGAFTPTCSAACARLPEELRRAQGKGVDTIVCMAVNDGFVMGAWGRSQNVGDKIRMLGDGSAAFTKALGLELDLTAKGMAYAASASLLVDNGVVKQVNIEGVGRPTARSFREHAGAARLSAIVAPRSPARASVPGFLLADLPDNPPTGEFHAQHPCRRRPPISLPTDKEVALRVIPMPADANANGDIFGGWIMSQVDLAGSIPAVRRAKRTIIAVAVNQFISPAGCRSATW